MISQQLLVEGGVKGYRLYGATGPGAITFWEAEELLAAAKKRPIRECFKLEEKVKR